MRSLGGYTLTELLVIVTIVALAASVALPSLEPVDRAKVDLVSREIGDALRFARSEAQRTGDRIGIAQDDATARTRVFRNDGGAQTFDVYHPVDKHLYDRRFADAPFSFGGSISTSTTFRGTCNDPGAIEFDPSGTAWCADPANVLLDRLSLTVTLGTDVATIQLDGVTGRVTPP